MPIPKLCILLIVWALSLPAYSDYTLINTRQGTFDLLDETDKPLLTVYTIAFQKGWKWTGFKEISKSKIEQGARYSYNMQGELATWDALIQQNNNQFTIDNTLTALKPMELTYIGLALRFGKVMNDGRLELTNTNNKTESVDIPLRVKEINNITQIRIFNKADQLKITLDFKQPANLHLHNDARIKLVSDTFSPPQTLTQTLSFKAKQPIQFYSHRDQIPNTENKQNWFAFSPKNKFSAGQIGMQDWLMQSKKNIAKRKDIIEKDGKKATLWGTNVQFIGVAPSRKNAVQRTDFFAKYGIDSVRLHKITNANWEGLGSTIKATEYDRKKIDRFDFWLSRLKKQGINYGLSPIWDLVVYEGDKDRLLAYDELLKANPQRPITRGLVWFAEDIQDIHIETIVNLLNHKNRHTGLRYADDPSIDYVEIQNEENVFFYTFNSHVKKYPTYHRLLAKKFSQWLKEKYQSHDKLVKSWGKQAINTFKREGGLPDEHLNKNNITPVISPWFYDNQATKGHRAKRLQDTAEFLLAQQQNYYNRAIAAIRSTGYQGLIVSGNWQAGSKGAHFLNLYSDAQVGIIDRHNYQGGAKGTPGHLAKSGFSLNNTTMLGSPGSTLLSTGMQQVKDHPFMFSEWLAVVPSEYAAADTALVAAYGFGLQGWDISYHFASDGDQFPDTLNPRDAKFNNITPVGIGLYPVLARMVRRGDITEAEPIAIRRLSPQQALTNQYDFENTLYQKNDDKSITGTPDHRALAAGKVLIEFTKDKGVSDIKNWEQQYLNKNADGSRTITSSTNQLKWTYTPDTDNGFVEINSQGTQGIVGFTPQKNYPFDDIAITPKSPYSVILTTAKSPTGTLNTDKEALILAIARAHNTNMNIKGNLITNMGEAPIILEPVKATLSFKRDAIIEVLDHDGMATGKTYELKDGTFELDTGRDKALYYLVRYKD